MTFSIGQNFFNDLLKSSDKITNYKNPEKAIKLTYDLQVRLADFWKNNDKPLLLKSQLHSGNVDLAGNETPLGGSINFNLCGITNDPNSCKDGCPTEYPFWGTPKEEHKIKDNKQENFENINSNNNQNIIEQPQIVENFTLDNTENFEDNDNTINIILIILTVIIVIFLILGIYLYIRNK